MHLRKNISSGSPLEAPIGFSRAVRVGQMLAVSGTAPLTEEGTTAAPGDLYAQTIRCLEITKRAIEQGGGSLAGVYRTRVLITDISRWKAAARAHGEFFGEIRPACTFVEVGGFINRDWLVEIEADCYLGKG